MTNAEGSTSLQISFIYKLTGPASTKSAANFYRFRLGIINATHPYIMSTDDTLNIQKFYGKHGDDCHLWRLRCEIALKSKGYWSQLSVKDSDQNMKDRSSAMIVATLDDSALRVCIKRLESHLRCCHCWIRGSRQHVLQLPFPK